MNLCYDCRKKVPKNALRCKRCEKEAEKGFDPTKRNVPVTGLVNIHEAVHRGKRS